MNSCFNMKQYNLCPVSYRDKKGKDFFARGSPYSDGIAQVALSSPPLM
ncbi:hypothetical protein CSC12_2964 [Klebsiella michiganensis]|nr:hypothetical protein CSC12_2964 [Klebsiella michiganensis]